MTTYSLGWQRELPDHRDWFIDTHPEAIRLCERTARCSILNADAEIPTKMDLTQWCSPIENQGNLGSCTAQAAVGCVEYHERRATRAHIEGSRLFVYKATRNILGWRGDTGAYIRTTLQALRLFGCPPEKYWPYDTARFDEEPTPFVYAYGQSFRAMRYMRLDRSGQQPMALLDLLRSVVAKWWPVMFGFTVYTYGNASGEFVMPGPNDKPLGGHAVLAVGYDDQRVIGQSTGAIKIRNSWGTGWGERGYGWLPYDYVTKGLSSDFWTVYNQEYLMDL